jgi:hypothetical protein
MMPTMCNMPDLSDLQARSPHGAFVIHQFIGAGNGLPRRGSTIVVAHGRRIAQPLRSLTDGRFYVRLDDDSRSALEEVGKVQAGNIGYCDAGRLELRTMFRSRPASQA